MSTMGSDDYSRGYREDRHRSSRHEDRDRDHHRDHHRDRYGYRDRVGEREHYGRRDDDRRERYGRERGDDDYGRHGSRPEEDRRRRRDERDERGREGGRSERRGRGRPKDSLERRSPTPEGCVALSQRKRKASGWDVHAPGYEQYTALQAKQTGLFNLPGANRIQVPPILGIAGLPPPMPVQSFGMGTGVNPNLSRQSRRLYVGGITNEVTEQNLADFFNQKMAELNIGKSTTGNPVLAVQCNYEKNYAFVEFRSADDATAAMAFDGIIFISGPLKIRRPKDYGGDLVTSTSPVVHVPGVVSTNVPDSMNKIFVGGLPTYLNEEQVMELLKSFGELKAFNLVRENGTGTSKGFAFCEYVDPVVTDVAIQSLNGMELGDRYLVVQRASVGAKQGMIPNMDSFPEMPRPIMPAGTDNATETCRILLMLNMVTSDDLVDDEEYNEIYEDVKDECTHYGALEDLRIPRPVRRDKTSTLTLSAQDAQRMDEAAGVGRVYVKYQDPKSASAALNSLAGRSFAGRSIIATLLADDSQTTPPLNIIFAPQPEAPPPLPSS